MKTSFILFITFLFLQCQSAQTFEPNDPDVIKTSTTFIPITQGDSLSKAAMGIIDSSIQYIPNYVKIKYPNGDVPAHTGVCADVIIRAFRKMNIDLQKEIHEDMRKNFAQYPRNWGLSAPDANIDHRRVPNLMTYFSRKGWTQPITDNAKDYLPGDVVAWMLPGNLTHIGIVVHHKNESHQRNLIVHNIGGGQVSADCLFQWKIIGHYRIQ